MILSSGKYAGRAYEDIQHHDPFYLSKLVLYSNVEELLRLYEESRNQLAMMHAICEEKDKVIKKKNRIIRRLSTNTTSTDALRRMMTTHVNQCNYTNCTVPGCSALYRLQVYKEYLNQADKEMESLTQSCLEKDEKLEQKNKIIKEFKDRVISDESLKETVTKHVRACKLADCDVPGCVAQRKLVHKAAYYKKKHMNTPPKEPIGVQCCVCQESNSDVAFLHGDTAHLCVCSDCVDSYTRTFKDVCPLCQYKECRVVKVY